MREPIKLIDYKEEQEYIKQERAKLDMRELGAYKEIRNLFQKQVEEYLIKLKPLLDGITAASVEINL